MTTCPNVLGAAWVESRASALLYIKIGVQSLASTDLASGVLRNTQPIIALGINIDCTSVDCFRLCLSGLIMCSA